MMKQALYKRYSLIFIAGLTAIITSGCTQKFNDVSATVQEAYSNYIDVELSPQEIEEIPYASAYLRIGSQKQVFVVLAFAELNRKTQQTQLKWVSADKAMIVTENGRIVKTIGLQTGNLAGIYDLPINGQLGDLDFELSYDWEESYRYGFPAEVSRKFIKNDTVETPLKKISTSVYEEKISFPTLAKDITNTYWVNNEGDVVKSIQYLGPQMVPIEITVLKEYNKS